jgi:hypothetical protein
MSPEVGRQVVVLLRRNGGTTAGERGGGRLPGRPLALPIAIDGADTDAEDAGGLGFLHPGIDGLEDMQSQIEGVGTHLIQLLPPLIVSPRQRLCKPL